MSVIRGKKPYFSIRDVAWRNTVVAGTNAGLEHGLFSMCPGDNRWPYHPLRPTAKLFRFSFADGVPALASVRDIGYDELEIAVALWPKLGAEARLDAFYSGLADGDVIATGMIERRQGAWLQSSPNLFRCRKHRLRKVAAVAIEPNGYCDRGELII
jgi:hypothetical protein